MVSLHTPNSIISVPKGAINRPSEVPPLVDNSGVNPKALIVASNNFPCEVRNGFPEWFQVIL
jgi:hypothetical protein